MTGAVPHQTLMSPGGQLDGLPCRGVAGQRSMMGAVHPDDLGQQMRVGGIGLRPRGGVTFPVTGHRHRVDREHLVSGSGQRSHPRSPIGLDPNLDHGRSLGGFHIGPLDRGVFADQGVQAGNTIQALG